MDSRFVIEYEMAETITLMLTGTTCCSRGSSASPINRYGLQRGRGLSMAAQTLWHSPVDFEITVTRGRPAFR
jgi:hypothetical protein